jgi:hypothetical protein
MFDLVHKVTFYQIIFTSTYLTDFTLEEQVSDWQHPFIYMVTPFMSSCPALFAFCNVVHI